VFYQVRDRSTRRSTRRLGRESGVASPGGEGTVASEVAALVKEATDLVGLIGEVTGVWGAGAAAKHSARSTPIGTPRRCRSAPAKVSGMVSVSVPGGDALGFVQQSRRVVGYCGAPGRCGIWVRCRFGGASGSGSTGSAGRRLGFCHEVLRSDPSAARARAFLCRVRGDQSGDGAGLGIGWALVDSSVVPEHLRGVGVSARDMVARHGGGGRLFATHVGRVLYAVVTGPERVSGFRG